MSYEPPRITDYGTLTDLTRSVLPSAGIVMGQVGGFSVPLGEGGDGGGAPTTVVDLPSEQTVQPQSTQGPGDGGPAAEAGPTGGGDGPGDEQEVLPQSVEAPASERSGSGSSPDIAAAQPLGGGGAGGGAPGGDDGSLPFTGAMAGVIGSIGAAFTGAGLALRRHLRRRDQS